MQAAQDALLKAPADEVLIFEHCEEQSKWYEEGLLEKAQEGIEPPLRVVVVETGDDDHPDHVVDVEETGRGTINPIADQEIGGGAYVPGLTRSDFAGMVAGIVGTIIVAILAAAVAGGEGHETGWEAVAILIAIGIALANLAHVVGLTLFEAVRYRGGFAKFFRTLALIVTPAGDRDQPRDPDLRLSQARLRAGAFPPSTVRSGAAPPAPPRPAASRPRGAAASR